ncbi:OmpH family outer membrane protein [Flavobacterium sp.]|uniref:OmpH family outer membrane protein n=1 Tax=Flavobacterium sp. TaxID=239 RepID=UPI003F69DE70
MKNLKSIFIAAALFLSAQFATAQSKVAHIDVSVLMTTMPEYKNAQAQLEKIQKSYEDEYGAMVNEFQTKMEKYKTEAENGTATEALNETRGKEMEDMRGRIQLFRENSSKELETKSGDMLKPIFEKAQAAIQKVAKAKGVSYVLDATSPGTLLYIEGGMDLMADVKKELGF